MLAEPVRITITIQIPVPAGDPQLDAKIRRATSAITDIAAVASSGPAVVAAANTALQFDPIQAERRLLEDYEAIGTAGKDWKQAQEANRAAFGAHNSKAAVFYRRDKRWIELRGDRYFLSTNGLARLHELRAN